MAVVKVPLTPLSSYKDERGNCIKYDGPLNENIVVTFRGSNNNVTVHETAHVTKLNIDFNSNNGTFSLGGQPTQTRILWRSADWGRCEYS